MVQKLVIVGESSAKVVFLFCSKKAERATSQLMCRSTEQRLETNSLKECGLCFSVLVRRTNFGSLGGGLLRAVVMARVGVAG